MNAAQIVYVICLALIFVVRRPNRALWVVLANCMATLAVCEAMDLGWLVRNAQVDDVTMAEMLIDFASMAALLSPKPLPLVIASGYFTSVLCYTLTINFNVHLATTFAIVNSIAFIQLLVVAVGSDGNHGGRRLARLGRVAVSMGTSRRNLAVDRDNNSALCRGR